MNDIDEQLLLQRLATPATRHEAIELLVKTYAQPLYWKIRRMVLVHEDADDLVQNVFLKAWSALDNFKQQAKLSTWLYRIAINEALDFLRKQKNATSLQGTSDHTLANQLLADDYFDGDATQARLLEAIAELPEVQRTVFNLRYFDDMKYEEISVILSTSVGALKASYHLAVKKLRKIMDVEWTIAFFIESIVQRNSTLTALFRHFIVLKSFWLLNWEEFIIFVL